MGALTARTKVRWSAGLAAVVVLAGVATVARSDDWAAKPTTIRAVARVVEDDAGDAQATTTFDGPMVRKRTAIAVHPARGADRARIGRELRAAATTEKVGPLTDATFAVFSEELMNYLVPEMTLVLPEQVSVADGEAFMRDHQPSDVAFYLVEPVLVHDLTFAVLPAAGVTPDAVQRAVDREGILADSLNHYTVELQRSGLTVRYFGAILSDGQVQAVRESLARAAHVGADRVAVEASSPGPGVDLSNGTPILDTGESHHHS